MKQYTHAWIAFMAIKRLQSSMIPKGCKKDADSLVKWFHNYRDFVIQGAWYPDEVFKDMNTSHILKYEPLPGAPAATFRKYPTSLEMPKLVKKSPLLKQGYKVVAGNLPDRCESLAHGIVDCLKMLEIEEKGCPISPTSNHIAMRFFILSHYIADCHMPLHCDSRSFSEGDEIHAFIEGIWDQEIRKSYALDTSNERFFYDPDGYPLSKGLTPMIQAVEDQVANRKFIFSWGTDNNNTWDYMSAISQQSYLMAHRMIPSHYNHENLTKEAYLALDEQAHFESDSVAILSDAIDSVARAWLHVWARYQDWKK
ncbi:MAG: S1/P1 nuclease [Bacteroidales bacterium]|nr:S1/P1 nuclease [Bacteroidales bacterium]